MYNPITRKVLNLRKVTWGNWHGIVSPGKGMTVFTPKRFALDYDNATCKQISLQNLQIPEHVVAQGKLTTPAVTPQQFVRFEVPKSKGNKTSNLSQNFSIDTI